MAETTIPWAHFTFNPWWGCVEAGPECDNCYARTWAHRTGHEVWGKDAPRRFFGPEHWNKPLAWNAAAEKAGVRFRVFCASMADVLEDRADLAPARGVLWELIRKTPALDWLLLTKRPQGFRDLVPPAWHNGEWPRNVWAGTSCGTQAGLARVRTLLEAAAPAPVRFVSAEPLLEAIDWGTTLLTLGGITAAQVPGTSRVDWLILGGESGGKARPCDLAWLRSSRDQAHAAGVVLFVKQLGARPVDSEWRTGVYAPHDKRALAAAEALGVVETPPNLLLLKNAKGEDPAEWPEYLRVREFPEPRP